MRFLDSGLEHLGHYVDTAYYGAKLKLIKRVTLRQEDTTGDFDVTFSLFWKTLNIRHCNGRGEFPRDLVMLRHNLAVPDVYARSNYIQKDMMQAYVSLIWDQIWT